MSNSPIVYKLSPILDNSNFEGLASAENTVSIRGKKYGYLNDFTPDSPGIDQVAPSLAAIWRPIKVLGRVREQNDYPCLDLLVPAFSSRAVELLGDVLEANGELLPLEFQGKIGKYFAYNVTTIVDAIDRDRSDISWISSDPGPWDARSFHINRFEFFPEKLMDRWIFRIPELSKEYFVTQLFFDIVKSKKLQGFAFDKVWPLPENVNWMDLRKANSTERQRMNFSTDRP